MPVWWEIGCNENRDIHRCVFSLQLAWDLASAGCRTGCTALTGGAALTKTGDVGESSCPGTQV